MELFISVRDNLCHLLGGDAVDRAVDVMGPQRLQHGGPLIAAAYQGGADGVRAQVEKKSP